MKKGDVVIIEELLKIKDEVFVQVARDAREVRASLKTPKPDIKYFKTKLVLLDNVELINTDLDHLIEELSQMKETLEELKKEGRNVYIDTDFIPIDMYGGEYPELYSHNIEIRERTLPSEYVEAEQKEKFRVKVAELLGSKRPPEYSMLKLFFDGAIDWETLKKITKKDCEI